MEGWNLESTYADLPEIFFSNQKPAPIQNPHMLIFNEGLAQSLGLNSHKLKSMPEVFAGNTLPFGAQPISQAYAGFQFGQFTMLGDGRAVLLGERITPEGRRFDIQLKGSGRTPYSRRGDGLAALSPMLREYIISEAMFHLGIPTTRSLAVVLTGQDVFREKVLQGAILTRVASSHIRVGTFDYLVVFGTKEHVQKLSDYCIWRHFPWLENEEEKYLLFLREVCKLQAHLIAKWQLVGFIHGVMNTDNMAISGETIDYGPCAFMDTYNPITVFSSIDTYGRYAYRNQPVIGTWNLGRFAQALLPLLHGDQENAIELADKELAVYWETYQENWLSGMRAKLGLTDVEEGDSGLISELLDVMEANRLDYTTTLRSLSFAQHELPSWYDVPDKPEFNVWREKWKARLGRQSQSKAESMDLMKKHNPAVIPRNYLVEEALAAAEDGDMDKTSNLLEALRRPFEDSEVYSPTPPEPRYRYKTFCGT